MEIGQTGQMSGFGLLIRRGTGAVASALGDMALDRDSPQRILRGDRVRHGRVFLARAATMWHARGLLGRTGHTAIELWLRGAPVVYELDERAEVSIEFANGLVLMAGAHRARGAMHLTPLRRELQALDLVLVPMRHR
jgi:hypothetical protein